MKRDLELCELCIDCDNEICTGRKCQHPEWEKCRLCDDCEESDIKEIGILDKSLGFVVLKREGLVN